MKKPTPTDVSKTCGISVSYASQLLGGTRTPSQALAIRLFDAFGLKLGPLSGLSDCDAASLAKIMGNQGSPGSGLPTSEGAPA
ncbi:helix-turn-helix domain-containing protein [Stakelama tenebrarum]|uniref:Helix-turn-helix transcriptional regulator n=1 Tax=Stakelama tenebrarum TaxID=2711215 RepID=A0A6G6Y4X2_9SPHN|nr:helix-turn-helix transcriptional regulator [Sphingosinithalassobacter tenebrarum]QIG79965.1 helix-turn-helix transcriptional regulator [Sphingosinithalassobacter tenebrarum]